MAPTDAIDTIHMNNSFDLDYNTCAICLEGSLAETYLLEAIAPEVVCDKLYSVLHWTDDPDNVGHETDPGITFWRPMTHPGPKSKEYPNGKIAPELEQQLWRIAEEFTGRSYERNPLEEPLPSPLTRTSPCNSPLRSYRCPLGVSADGLRWRCDGCRLLGKHLRSRLLRLLHWQREGRR